MMQPPEHWLAHTQLKPPEHWLRLVAQHAPQLLEGTAYEGYVPAEDAAEMPPLTPGAVQPVANDTVEVVSPAWQETQPGLAEAVPVASPAEPAEVGAFWQADERDFQTANAAPQETFEAVSPPLNPRPVMWREDLPASADPALPPRYEAALRMGGEVAQVETARGLAGTAATAPSAAVTQNSPTYQPVENDQPIRGLSPLSGQQFTVAEELRPIAGDIHQAGDLQADMPDDLVRWDTTPSEAVQPPQSEVNQGADSHSLSALDLALEPLAICRSEPAKLDGPVLETAAEVEYPANLTPRSPLHNVESASHAVRSDDVVSREMLARTDFSAVLVEDGLTSSPTDRQLFVDVAPVPTAAVGEVVLPPLAITFEPQTPDTAQAPVELFNAVDPLTAAVVAPETLSGYEAEPDQQTAPEVSFRETPRGTDWAMTPAPAVSLDAEGVLEAAPVMRAALPVVTHTVEVGAALNAQWAEVETAAELIPPLAIAPPPISPRAPVVIPLQAPRSTAPVTAETAAPRPIIPLFSSRRRPTAEAVTPPQAPELTPPELSAVPPAILQTTAPPPAPGLAENLTLPPVIDNQTNKKLPDIWQRPETDRWPELLDTEGGRWNE